MKILFLMRFWPYFGGGETVTRLLISEFLRRGYEMYVAYWWDRSENRVYLDKDKILKFKMKVPSPSSTNDIPSSCYETVFLQLADLIDKHNIDIVINQWWPYEIFKNSLKIPLISCHHLSVMKKESNYVKKVYHHIFPRRFYAKAFEKLNGLYKVSDALVFLAHSYQCEFEKYTPSFDKEKKTFFIHNPSTYSGDTTMCTDKKKEILFVGRIYENHKKVSRLLYVWKNLLDLGYLDWKLKIIGDGPDLEKVKLLSGRLNLCNIEFLGSKDPYEDYLTASIFVLTSQVEGWPMTIVEAQHFGAVPVVMNNFSALNEMLSNHSGVIVDSSDPQKMALEIADLIEDKKKMALYSQNAIRQSKLYEVSKICDDWDDLIKKIIRKFNENHLL